ncbi:MAG: hypothetical protein NVSMB19_01430 [Vulcanimicrobiaceae bacterium]
MFRRDAKLELAYPVAFATQWVAILVGVAGFYFISKLVTPNRALGFGGQTSSYFSYVIVNVAFMILQTNAVQSFATTLRRDQMFDMIEPIFATPTPVGLLAFSSGLWKLAVSLVQVVTYLGIAALFFGLDLSGTNVGTLLVFVSLSVACMSSIGVIGAGIVIYSKHEPPSSFLVGGAASLLAGVIFPVAMLPAPLRAVSWALPITHSLAGVRGAVHGAQLWQLSSDAVWLTIATLLLLPAALLTFAWAVDRARSDGTLAQY